MTFDDAFEQLIGHEGGYVNHPKYALKYVNEHISKTHSHKQRAYFTQIIRGCSFGRVGQSIIHMDKAGKHSGIYVFSPRLRQASVLQGLMQRALYSLSKWCRYEYSSSSQKARGLMRSLRGNLWRKGWLGHVPKTLSTGTVYRPERCSHSIIWRGLRQVQRGIPPISIRLSPYWEKDRSPKCSIYEQICSSNSKRIDRMHIALRQLSQSGALQ